MNQSQSTPAATAPSALLSPSPDEKLHHLEARVRELEDVERRYRKLIDQMPDMVLRVDRHLQYLEVNTRFCEIFGVPREELIGRAVGTVRPELGGPWRSVFSDVLQAGEAREAAFAHDTPEGRRWFETRLVPELSAEGEVMSVLAVARDVTDRHEAEQARKASEARLRLLLDQAPAILWTTDEELRFTSLAGAAVAGISGPVSPLMGRTMEDVVQARPDDVVMIAHRRALGGRAVEYDFQFDDHSYRCRVEPLRDAQSRIIGVVGVSLDITELKRAEDELRQLNAVLEARVTERTSELARTLVALRQSEAMFRALLEQMPDGLFVMELEDDQPSMRIVLVNEAAARMQGQSAQELIGQSYLDLCDDQFTCDQLLGQVEALRQGDVVRLEGNQRRHEDGVFPMELTARVVQYGDRRVALGLVRDVTERRAAEAQLRLVESAVNQVTDAVIITDASIEPPGPRIIYVNPAFERMTGYSASEALGQNPRILQGSASDRPTLRRVREHMIRGEAFDGEVTNHRKDGTSYIIAWHMAPIRNDAGEVTNWVAIQRDVTDARRQAELQRQHQAELAHVSRLSMMGELASGLAHELNQPLAAIANYARGGLRRLESEGISDDRLHQALDRIAAQADRSGQIIQRMRQFVRKRELQRAWIDPNDLMREALMLVEPDAQRRSTELELDLAEGLQQVLVDSIQIEQVLVNLVRNGIEAMLDVPASERRLVLRSEAQAGAVLLSVRDRGPGLDQVDLDRVFNPFFTTKSNGMGMGLTISRTIVETHGGKLWATHNEDRGMTFFLLLPPPAVSEAARDFRRS